MVELKPEWFYEWIGMVAKHNNQLAINLFDAICIDEVRANVTMHREMEDVDSWYSHGAIAQIPGQTTVTILLQDSPPPFVRKRFPDKVFDYVETPSFTYWVIEMGKEGEGKYKAIFCFRDMLEDQWYFVKPNYIFVGEKKVSPWGF